MVEEPEPGARMSPRMSPRLRSVLVKWLVELPCSAGEGGDEDQGLSRAVSRHPTIERPIPFAPATITQGLAGAERWNVMIREFVPWSAVVLQRFWECGYDRRDLLDMFVSIPPGLCDLLKRACRALEILMKTQSMMVRRHRMGTAVTASAAEGCSAAFADSRRQDAEEDAGMPEEVAYVSTRFDPDTQRLVSLYPSKGMEGIVGQHHEEIVARWAQAENVQPLNQFEVLCLMIEQLFEPNTDRVVYHRCVNVGHLRHRHSQAPMGDRDRPSRTGFLRHANRYKLDEYGRVIGVMNVLSWVSEEEFDRQLRLDPRKCRPLMYELGDTRSAAELLESCGRDRCGVRVRVCVRECVHACVRAW